MQIDYTTIAVSGSDRIAFLQGQLTQDVLKVTPQQGLHAAWCNAKGRVLVTCRVFTDDDSYFLPVPSESAALVMQRLTMYRLRADVQLEVNDQLKLRAYTAKTAPESLPRVGTPFDKSYIEVLLPVSATGKPALDTREWAVARCAHGIVEIHGKTAERYTPHMLNLDRCGAISFSKGCYTGQEVVARTEHLGKVKRRVARYRWDGDTVALDTELSDGERSVGKVVDAADGEVLAVVPSSAQASTLYIDDKPLVPAALPYPI